LAPLNQTSRIAGQSENITRCFRVSKGPEVADILNSIESFEAFARSHGPGRYQVDEHSLDPSPGTKVSARAWGKVNHHQDGRIAIEPHPWLAS
jgi:hypothetical protein